MTTPLRRIVSRLLRRALMGVAFAVGAGGVGACYSYRPLSVDALPVGTRVVADLTDRGGVELADTVGGTAVRLSGRVNATSPERMVLSLNQVTFRQGRAVTWGGEPVGVPRQYVLSVRERKFSWWRSALAGAAVTTGFLYTINKLGVNIGWLGGPLGDGGGGGPGTGGQ
jgi:hypothetical protein